MDLKPRELWRIRTSSGVVRMVIVPGALRSSAVLYVNDRIDAACDFSSADDAIQWADELERQFRASAQRVH